MFHQMYLDYVLKKLTGRVYHLIEIEQMDLKDINWEVLQSYSLSSACVELDKRKFH